MSAIRHRMIEDMQLHGYAAKTQEAYVGAVRGLAKYYKRSPADITQDEVRANCLIKKLTFEINVASKKVLPYSETWISLEGTYDESTKQTRITGSHSAALPKS